MTPACWEKFVPAFEARGFRCVAPAWPGKDRSIEAIRADPSPLAGLGIGEIVDHYDRLIRPMATPPILVGHSFGGLFVQLLLDRGLGAAGIAIDPAPPRGVFPFYPSAVRALGRILLIPFGWRKAVRWTLSEFRYGFVHTMPRDEARATFDRYVVPETGRIFFQGAVAMIDRRSPARINFGNPVRPPLLLIAGGADHVVPAAAVRGTFRRQRVASSRTDLREFPGRTHWLIAADGWEDVAGACMDWIDALE
jgi:pimeloyl-ACP methyl ester carboxylesterase